MNVTLKDKSVFEKPVLKSRNNKMVNPTNSPHTNRLEILYDGFYYDITEFAIRHPGGDIILYYTAKGEDATQVIQQFHNRFFPKVELLLKSFKRRQPAENEISQSPDELKRHQNITKDFNELFNSIKAEGLFEPSYLRIIWRIIECTFIWISGVYFCGNPTFLFQLFGAVLFGFGTGRSGWIMHEAGHHSLTGNHTVDRRIQSVVVGILSGVAGGWFRRHHFKHHCMPQRIDHDLDLNTMPVLANAVQIVKTPKQGKSFLIQNQKWLFLFLDCFLATIAWKLYCSPRSATKYRNYFDLLMMGIHWWILLTFVPPWAIILATWIAGTYLFGNFALSHSRLPIARKQTHWVEYAFLHTANIKSSLWMDWWTGYLNFEIVHHLFPTLPPFRSYLVRDRVMALAAKYDLPYHEYSYMEAWRQNFENLEQVAQHFKMK